MKTGLEPITFSKNKFKLATDKLVFWRYNRLLTPIKRAVTQVKFRDYLDRNGFCTIADFMDYLESQPRRSINDSNKLDKERFYIEEESGYWYKLAKGQPISNCVTIFFVNEAIGMRSLFGFRLFFWETLNRHFQISFSAWILPKDIKKQIFRKHYFPKISTPEQLSENTKRLYKVQLVNLYDNKSIDALHGLTILFILHHFRSGKRQSRKVELYLYAQFLYLMVYKYEIQNVDKIFVLVCYLLIDNSIYKTGINLKSLNCDQLYIDHTFVKSLASSSKLLLKSQQGKFISEKIMDYLKEQKNHPLFHSYE